MDMVLSENYLKNNNLYSMDYYIFVDGQNDNIHKNTGISKIYWIGFLWLLSSFCMHDSFY